MLTLWFIFIMFCVGGSDGEIIVWNNSTENALRKVYKNTRQQDRKFSSGGSFLFQTLNINRNNCFYNGVVGSMAAAQLQSLGFGPEHGLAPVLSFVSHVLPIPGGGWIIINGSSE